MKSRDPSLACRKFLASLECKNTAESFTKYIKNIHKQLKAYLLMLSNVFWTILYAFLSKKLS
jgi:hypothetical protein